MLRLYGSHLVGNPVFGDFLKSNTCLTHPVFSLGHPDLVCPPPAPTHTGRLLRFKVPVTSWRLSS